MWKNSHRGILWLTGQTGRVGVTKWRVRQLSKALHILMLFRDFGSAGEIERALMLARAWRRRGQRVTIICAQMEGELLPRIPAGVDIRTSGKHVPRGRPSLRRFARAVPFTIDRLAPDILFLPDEGHWPLAQAVRHLPVRPKVICGIGAPAPCPLAGLWARFFPPSRGREASPQSAQAARPGWQLARGLGRRIAQYRARGGTAGAGSGLVDETISYPDLFDCQRGGGECLPQAAPWHPADPHDRLGSGPNAPSPARR